MTIQNTKILLVKKLPAANKFLPVPLNLIEKVINTGEITTVGEEQYIKVKHNHGKSVSVFSIRYFLPFNPIIERKLRKKLHL